MMIEHKLEKVIFGFYGLFIAANILYLVRTIFALDPIGASMFNPFFFAFFSIPIFAVLKIIYKRKYRGQILKNYQNIFTRRLKFVGIVIFISAIIIFIAFANILNNNLDTNYNDTPITSIYLMLSDLSKVLWPILFTAFALNFQKKRDINDRNQNLKNLVWSTVFFGLLIPFSKTIGLFFYDLELVLIISISNILSNGL